MSCFLSCPIYLINRTCLLALFRVHAHTHAHDKFHILLTKLSSLEAWPSTNLQSTRSNPHSKHQSNKCIHSPHASGLKVSCRGSHHRRLRRALFDRLRLKRDLDCTALEIDASTASLAARTVLLSPRPVSTTYTVYYLLLPTPPALAPPSRLLSNHERCITQPIGLLSACHYLPPSTLTWPSEAPPRPGFVRRLLAKARPLTSVLSGLCLGYVPVRLSFFLHVPNIEACTFIALVLLFMNVSLLWSMYSHLSKRNPARLQYGPRTRFLYQIIYTKHNPVVTEIDGEAFTQHLHQLTSA